MEMEKDTIDKSVGTILREARLAKGLSLEDVEAATHIYSRNLAHLENDEYAKTPGAFFVKGAIRNYGNFLGLNGPELVEKFKKSPAANFTTEVKEKPVADNSTAIREAKNVSMKVQLKDKRDIGSGTGKFEVKEKLKSVDIPWAKIGLGLAGLAVAGALYFAVPAIINWAGSISLSSSSTSSEVKQAQETPKKEEKAAKVIPDKLVLELEAVDKCWLEVTADGKRVEETMLRAGDKKTYEAKDKLLVKYGNVGAVRIKLNGEAQDVAGETGVANKVYSKEAKAEESKSEEAKPKEDVKTEAPRVQAPVVVEAPKEQPKAQAPVVVEAPKAQIPAVVEVPKAAAPAPAAQPKTEAPAAKEEPKVQAPAPAAQPKAEAPAVPVKEAKK